MADMDTHQESASTGTRSVMKWLLLGIKIVLMVFLYWYITRDLDWNSLKQTILSLSLMLAVYGLILQLLTQAAQAWRWKLFLKPGEGSFRECFAFISLSYPVSLVSPSRLLSDVAVGWMMGRRRKQVKRSVLAIFAGRVFGAGVLGLMVLLTLPLHLEQMQAIIEQGYITPGWLYFTGFGFLVLFILGLFLAKRRFTGALGDHWNRFRIELMSPKNLIHLTWTSIMIQVLPMLFTVLIFQELGVHLDLVHYFFILPLGLLILFVPVTPGQMGVREGLWVILFTLFGGVTREHVLAMVLYSYAAMVLFALVDGAIAAFLLKNSSEKAV